MKQNNAFLYHMLQTGYLFWEVDLFVGDFNILGINLRTVTINRSSTQQIVGKLMNQLYSKKH